MSSGETGQMSAVETRQMLKSQIRGQAFQQQWGLAQSQAKPRSWLTKVPLGVKNIKFSSKWVENRKFGLKLGPEPCQDRSGAFGGGLTHSKGPSLAWSWRSKLGPQCRSRYKSLKMVRVRSRIDRLARNKDQMNPTACADPSRPLLSS